jgi:hypothetical protein
MIYKFKLKNIRWVRNDCRVFAGHGSPWRYFLVLQPRSKTFFSLDDAGSWTGIMTYTRILGGMTTTTACLRCM